MGSRTPTTRRKATAPTNCTTSATSTSRKAGRSAAVSLPSPRTLNAAKDNAILVPTWYSGTSKIIEQAYIGEGRDPDKYFIVVVNQIGTWTLELAAQHAGTRLDGELPESTHRRHVRAQHQLLTERFGLTSLALVVGGSMGAQQTYEWAVRYPEMVKRAAAIAGTAKNTDHNFLFTETLVEAITIQLSPSATMSSPPTLKKNASAAMNRMGHFA